MIVPAEFTRTAQDWTVFRPYTVDHIQAVAGCSVAMLVPILLGLRWRDRAPSRERTLRIVLACGGLVFWLAYSLWWNWNTLDVERGLPLHVCDVAGIIAPLALLTRNRWFRATLYFWGLTLSLQGFIQPVLRVGPASLEYWGFWTAHAVIIGSALYDLIVGRFRPQIGDLARVVLVSLVYIAFILPFDIALDVNYGYVGDSKPENRTLIDALGPWPWRVPILFVIGVFGFVLIWLPWLAAERLRAARE